MPLLVDFRYRLGRTAALPSVLPKAAIPLSARDAVDAMF